MVHDQTNTHDFNTFDQGFLQHLISAELITDKVAGIAKQAIARGEQTLSAAQLYVLGHGIEAAVGELECECCGDTILHQDAIDQYGEIATRCQSCEFDCQKHCRT